MNWIDLARNKNRWLAVVNAVMNLRVPKNITMDLQEVGGGHELD